MRFEVGVSLLLAPAGADKMGPKAPFPLVENAWIQLVIPKRVPAGAPAGARSYWKHCIILNLNLLLIIIILIIVIGIVIGIVIVIVIVDVVMKLLRSTKWNANLILLRDYAELVALCKVIVWKTRIPVRTQK